MAVSDKKKNTKSAIQTRSTSTKSAPKKKAKKPVPPKEKKKPGRKPWVPDYGKIENWATQGLTDKEIAALSGVCPQKFSKAKNELNEEDPEKPSMLAMTLELGKAKGVAAVSQMLLGKALKGDNDMIKFYLERIGGRKNVTVIETPPKPVHEMSEEELLAIINGTPIS